MLAVTCVLIYLELFKAQKDLETQLTEAINYEK